jgi:hypothetical protein
MIHRYILRGGRHVPLIVAIMSLVTTIPFSNRGWAFVEASPPLDGHIRFVAESTSDLMADQSPVPTHPKIPNITVKPVPTHPKLPAKVPKASKRLL